MEVSRPVMDKTGLTGIYDFTLEWMPDTAPTSTPDAPSSTGLPGIPAATIFTALQQQLGLKLEPGKSPIEVIVIDHMERPSGN
jgi:bla regulator protein blaR1